MAKTTKSKVAICNIVIAVLCVLSIAAYFFFPLWKIDLNYVMTAEALQPTLDEMHVSGENGEELTLDAKDICGEDGLTITLSLQIKTSDVFHSLGEDAAVAVHNVIEHNVDNLVDQLNEPLTQVVKDATKAVAKSTLKNEVRTQIKNAITDVADEEVDQILLDAGITDTYIEDKLDNIMDLISADGATVKSVSAEIADTVEEFCEKLADADTGYDELKNLELSAADKLEIEDGVAEALEVIANEDGTISIDELLANLLLDAIGGEQENPEDEQGALPSLTPVSYAQTNEAKSDANSNTLEELKAELKAQLLEQIPPETEATIAQVLQIVCYVLFFTFFTWIYIIVKILAKLKKRNNAVKLKLPIWLGWLPFLVLVGLPSIALSVLQGSGMLGEEVEAAMSQFALRFSSSSIVSFIVAIFLALFSIFYYGRLRKRLKKGESQPENVSRGRTYAKAAQTEVDGYDYADDDYETETYDEQESTD